MAIVNFNSVSGVSTISATSSVTVGTGLTITTGGIVGITSINDGQIGGSRNMIINGSMVINQRGFTGTAGTTTNASYTTDRFVLGHSHDGVVSAGQTSMNSTTGGNAYANGFQSALILRVTTADATLAAGQFQLIRQRIEGYNAQGIRKGTANAEPVTLSFWVRSSTTGTYIAELVDNDNSRHCSKSYSINTANTWEKKSIIFPADTTGVLDNDENTSLVATWWLAAGSTYSGGTLATTWAASSDANRAVGQVNALGSVGDFWLTGVQLEVGEAATEFERRSYGQELALCQRYFERRTFDSNNQFCTALANTNNTAQQAGVLGMLVEKRSAASVSGSAASTFAVNWLGNQFTCTGVSFGGSRTTVYIDTTTASGTGTTGVLYRVVSGQTVYIDCNSEL